jgi:hypothetical protein
MNLSPCREGTKMAPNIRRKKLKATSNTIRQGVGNLFVKIAFCVSYTFAGRHTDEFLEILLKSMDFAFCWSKSLRKDHLTDFNAKYIFTSADNKVAASAIFAHNDMQVKEDAIEDWDAKVTFKSAQALRRFIYSEDQDVLDSILANEVWIDGNLNLIFKFGFMVKDLQHKFNIVI